MIMYNSLVGWLNTPIQVCTCDGYDIAGNVSYSDPVEYVCAVVHKEKTGVNKEGVNYTSSCQLFLNVDCINSDSKIILDNVAYFVKGVVKHYDFNTGCFSMCEVCI